MTPQALLWALDAGATVTGAPEQRSSRRLADTRRCMFYVSRSQSRPPCIRTAALRKPKRSVLAPQADLRSSKELFLLPRDNSYRIAPDLTLFQLPFPAGPAPPAAVSRIPPKGRRGVPAMRTSLELMFSLGCYVFSRLNNNLADRREAAC